MPEEELQQTEEIEQQQGSVANAKQKDDLIKKAKKATRVFKFMSASPALFWILMITFVIFLLISVVSIVGSMSGQNGGDPSAQYGINGRDFYGARMVYKDDEKANAQMVEDYVTLVENSVSEVQKINSVTVSGATYNLTLNINILFPEEDYDYSTFNETTFSTEYATLYLLIKDIAQIVYLADNGTAYSGETLIDCFKDIKYFGFANYEAISNKLVEKISANTTISVKDSGGNDVALTTEIQNAFTNQVTTNLTSANFKEKYSLRTEKLFVKDYILNGADEMISNVKKENYVAMIFMPKKNVTFKKFSFQISNTNFENFTISITANGTEIPVETDGANISFDEGSEAYVYSTSSNLNINAEMFDEDIDETNLNALSEEKSLFEIANSFVNYSTYLKAKADDNSVLTIKQNGVVVNLSNIEAFNIVEFETVWNA